MDNVFKDKRFNHVLANPRFKNMPRKDKKVIIDKRFQSMFTDKRFQVKFKVDERGRKINELQGDNYKKYYDITDSELSDDSEQDTSIENENSHKNNEDSDAISEKSSCVKDDLSLLSYKEPEEGSGNDNTSSHNLVPVDGLQSTTIESDISTDTEQAQSITDKTKIKEKLKEAQKEVNKYIDEIHKVKLNDKIREKLSDVTVDYARGIGTLLSGTESSSDESSSEESVIETIEHPWGELDKDAETTEEISRRLAICNMDWDRVTAKDLMVLFNSFLPSSGFIESVTIYPSEFGLARMAEEELKGPKELVENKEYFDTKSDEEELEEGSSYQREKLREYQLKRLKYYYAVVVCNSKEVANTLYTECDGLEYESSATKLDLRFIADDITFDQKPHDVCTTLPDLKKYKPRLFINTALQQGKVDLTWDETDPNRIDFTRKVLAGDEVDENEVQAYLASSSSEDEVTEEKQKQTEAENYEDAKTDQERIMKYRSLISDLQESNDRKKGDVEMEVSWGPESKSTDHVDVTEKVSDLVDSSEEISSDTSYEENKKTVRKKDIKKSKKLEVLNESSEDEKNNAELELLLADDIPNETGRHHFSLKAIQKEEKDSKKKKKWKKNLKKKNYQEEDTFKINTKDDRFSALFSSHHFNIDPADPHFRKTKAMNELIAEKQKRLKLS